VPDQIATVDDVIARLTAVGAEIAKDHGPADGVGFFNLLYLNVTKAVGAAITVNDFTEERFIARLDVVFAELYFDALDADRNGTAMPKAWQPLFDQRSERGIAPIQFAFAGMNAHINHDLAKALVSTWTALGKCDRDSPEFTDYVKVNDILERVEDEVKKTLEDKTLADVDADLGRADDVIAMWSVGQARAQAWTAAEARWDLRDIPGASKALEGAIDSLVGFAGHGLLTRVGFG
jgi:hypothetical protein